MQIATWGTHFFNADAQKCADEIMEICDNLGSANPKEIVEKARDNSTELHKCFTWDDSVASEKWRLHEARKIVCDLKIVDKREDKKQETVPIRVFYKTDDQSGYKPTKLILKNPDEYKQLVERCRNELLAIKNKYQTVSEYSEIWEMIN